MDRRTTLVGLLAIGALVTACGQPADVTGAAGPGTDAAEDVAADDPVGDQGGPAAGTCPVGTVDCVDADLDPEVVDAAPDTFDDEAARERGSELLGRTEEQLAGLDDVRVGSRDGEDLALTDDYVLGRRTVALATDSDGATRVTAVTVELTAGPETLTAGPETLTAE